MIEMVTALLEKDLSVIEEILLNEIHEQQPKTMVHLLS